MKENRNRREVSNNIKREVCENCKNRLKGILSDNEIKLFEDIFYKVTEGYVFKRKGEN